VFPHAREHQLYLTLSEVLGNLEVLEAQGRVARKRTRRLHPLRSRVICAVISAMGLAAGWLLLPLRGSSTGSSMTMPSSSSSPAPP